MAGVLEQGLLGEVFTRINSEPPHFLAPDIPGMVAGAKQTLIDYDCLPETARLSFLGTLKGELDAIKANVKMKAESIEKEYLESESSAQKAHEVADMYRQAGDHELASAWYRKALQHDPKHVRAAVGLSYTLLKEGDLQREHVEEAHRLLDEVSKVAPGLAALNLKVAAEHMSYVEQTEAGKPIDYMGEGLLFIKAEDFEDAKGSFLKAIEQDAQNAEAYNNLSCCELHIGEFGPALQSAIRALELNPKLSPNNLILAAIMAKHCIEYATRNNLI